MGSPDLLGLATPHTSSRHSPVTFELSKRLFFIAESRADPWYFELAERLLHCATNEVGWRCSRSCCPRCQGRAARRWRSDVEVMLLHLPSSTRIYHLTITVGADDIREGRTMLLSSFGKLRRQVTWTRRIDGGLGQVEILPAAGNMRRWNVHAHCLLLTSRVLAERTLSRAWSELLHLHDMPQSLKLQYVRTAFRLGHEDGGRFSPIGYYVTKRRLRDWLAFDDSTLIALVEGVHRCRLRLRFGSICKLRQAAVSRRRRSAHSVKDGCEASASEPRIRIDEAG